MKFFTESAAKFYRRVKIEADRLQTESIIIIIIIILIRSSSKSISIVVVVFNSQWQVQKNMWNKTSIVQISEINELISSLE